MSEKRASLEIIAPSIEEAVARGLAELGLSEDDVDVEVMDEGSRGLFGLGSRQARVRLAIKAGLGEPALTVEAPPAPSVDHVAELISAVVEAEPADGFEPSPLSTVEEDEDQKEMILRVARETVEELLERMKVIALVTAHFGEPDDARSKAPLLVDVHGDDLSILIGPRAETLNALQYVTALIIGKELGRAVPLVVDVEGYRARRGQQIRQLARRMADQAIKSGRRQILEPMPANERRLVHIELREHPDVKTESIGEDPRRKVTIIPKDW